MNDSMHTGLFNDLLTAKLATLKQTATELSLPAGHVIFRQGDAGDGIYLVENGCVEISAVASDGDGGSCPSLGRGASSAKWR